MYQIRTATQTARTKTARPVSRVVPSPAVVTSPEVRTRRRQALAEEGYGSVLPPVRTRNAELSAGSATAVGVTVQRVRVGPDVGYVVIDRSRGVQVGDGNRQLNKFSYRVEQPRVSVSDLLNGDPARLRAFERFVDNPYSAAANRAFRQRMPATAKAAGRVRCISTSAPGTTRVRARLDERGEMVVSNSRGVQQGSRVTQRNEFGYRVVKPELSIGPMLRGDPRMARAFALAARYPGNAAVRRSLTGRIGRAQSGPARSFSPHSAQFRQATGIEVSRADAVQFGSGNIREDRIEVNLGRVVLTGWTRPDETTRSTEDRSPRPPGALDRPAAAAPVRAADWFGSGQVSPGRSRRTAGRAAPDDDVGRPEPPQRPGRLDGGGGRFSGGMGRV